MSVDPNSNVRLPSPEATSSRPTLHSTPSDPLQIVITLGDWSGLSLK